MTQELALSILKTGANVFLTGEPGAGKTHTLNAYITYLREHGVEVSVTASTGIAATHIGGMTIHSWSGIGIKDSLSGHDLDAIASRERVAKRIAATKVLVIDEVSMLSAPMLDMVDRVLRTVRRSEQPFGGVQVVLVGDFFQLPPISRGGEAQFAYHADAWKSLELLVCYLTEQYRHDDGSLSSLLASIRTGEVDESIYDTLESCKETSFSEDIEPTRLYTHNADVDGMNAKRLTELAGDTHTFAMESRGQRALVEGLKKSCLSPETLVLKEGAMVMCTKNNFEVGYVNGTLGRVVQFDAESGYPVVATLSGEELTIAPASWQVVEGDGVLAEITQVPLRLAWAITVHKSQGMSLDAADMDLSRCFEYGQGYVALSRVRSLSGLLLRGANDRALCVHPEVLQQDRVFRRESESAEEAFCALEEVERMHEQFIRASGGTLERRAITAAKPKERISTYEETARMLKEGKTVAEVAEERGMTTRTIFGHLETLAKDSALTAQDVAHLAPSTEEEKKRYAAISAALVKAEDEKLSPVYRALKGAYTYDEIQEVRALRRILGDEVVH
jgi:ATP-dependent DNA helicase PIF1